MQNEQIWLEKYRPKNLNEIFGNRDLVERLKMMVEVGSIQNLILVGPPGTGKTSSILCLASILLGETYKDSVLELNASDERGIDTVRETIKGFAMRKVTLQEGQQKLVILDEADNLTEGAQQALRMIISDYSMSTRFVLSCNDSSKIIDPIQSRCNILRYTKLDDEFVKRRIQQIIKAENVKYDESGLDAIVYTADGDMRQAINNLQATRAGYGFLNKENVFKVCDVPNIDEINEIINGIMRQNFRAAQKGLLKLLNDSNGAYDITNTLNRIIQQQDNIPRNIQYEILREMAFLKMQILEGLPTFNQMNAFIAKSIEIVQTKNNESN